MLAAEVAPFGFEEKLRRDCFGLMLKRRLLEDYPRTVLAAADLVSANGRIVLRKVAKERSAHEGIR